MTILVKIALIMVLSITLYSCHGNTERSDRWPTIAISVLVRNKAQQLPYYLSSLEHIDYPKERIYIWMYSDYNEDNSADIIRQWANNYGSEYNRLFITIKETLGSKQEDQNKASQWTPMTFKHVISWRQKALDFARKMWADFVFMLDADVFLTEPNTLKALLAKDKPVVAPMLLSDGLYSNFWMAMTDDYYYLRTDDYAKVVHREKTGCFLVPMVHSAVLINLREKSSDLLTYDPARIENYDGPFDDIINFALTAKRKGVEMYICNDNLYGFIPIPLEEKNEEFLDYQLVRNVKLEALSRGVVFPLDPGMDKFVTYPKKWKLGLSQVFVINLERRVERRRLMEKSLQELGVEAEFFKAVDGKNIDLRDLKQYSVTLLPSYEDSYHKRPMKTGEIGCFLSHYEIWKEIARKNYELTMVLEDDIHFEPFFTEQLLHLIEEIRNTEWDLLYLGRKIMQGGEERYFTSHTTKPLYSYWTLGYLIRESGARKLIKAEPLSKMLPVDEYLPIMFNQHPNTTWKSFFPKRNLIALSAAPLLIHPTHYTGQVGYISDTEDSIVINDAIPFKEILPTIQAEIEMKLRSDLRLRLWAWAVLSCIFHFFTIYYHFLPEEHHMPRGAVLIIRTLLVFRMIFAIFMPLIVVLEMGF